MPYWRLSADRLAAAIRNAVTDPTLRATAEAVAARRAKEDGAAAVVDAVENPLG